MKTPTTAASRPAPKPGVPSIDGVVRFAGDHKPESFTVSLSDRTETFRSAEGKYRIENIPGPLVTLHFEAPGFAGANVYTVMPVDGDGWAEVTLHPECAVRGVVRDAKREPVGGAMVTATYAELTKYFSQRPSAQTANDGTFEVGDLPPGRAYFSIGATGLARAFAGAIDVKSGEPAKFEVALEPAVPVSGRVKRRGKPVAGANVQLRVDQANAATLGLVYTSVETEDDGTFAVGDVAKGSRRVVVSMMEDGERPRGMQRALRVTIPPKGTSKLDVELGDGPTRLKVKFPSGEPGELLLVKGKVDARKSLDLEALIGVFQYTHVEAADSEASFEDVGSGVHTLVLMPPEEWRMRPGGCHCMQQQVEIGRNAKEVKVELIGTR